MPDRTPPKPGKVSPGLETILKIVILNILNGTVMFAILALGAKGRWRNAGEPLDYLYPFIAIGCGWFVFSFVSSIRLWLRNENDRAIKVAVRVIPVTVMSLLGLAATFALVGGTIVIAAPHFGFEIPCAFRWPRCSE
jgi:hypothetical protein